MHTYNSFPLGGIRKATWTWGRMIWLCKERQDLDPQRWGGLGLPGEVGPGKDIKADMSDSQEDLCSWGLGCMKGNKSGKVRKGRKDARKMDLNASVNSEPLRFLDGGM